MQNITPKNFQDFSAASKDTNFSSEGIPVALKEYLANQLRYGLFVDEGSRSLNWASQFQLDDKMLKQIRQDPKDRIFSEEPDMRQYFLKLK